MKSELKNKLLTKKQLADYYGVCIETINRRVKDGTLTPIKFGRLVRFRREDIESQTEKP